MRLKSNLLELDRFLGAYPFDIWNKWTKLTDKITDDLVKKLEPECGKIQSALEQLSSDSPFRPRWLRRLSSAEAREERLLPQLRPLPGTELRLTPFPKRIYPEGSTPAQITKHYLDKTYALDTMIDSCDRAIDFIGEFQFVFICFLVGLNLESFEHWKEIVRLFCSCDTAVRQRPSLYELFIDALEVQLVEIPEDFLVDIVSSNNLIYESLRDLFRTVRYTESVDGQLQTKAEIFKERLTLKFLWDYSDLDKDDDDDSAVVVDL